MKHWMQLGPFFTLVLLALALWLGVATWAKAQHVESSSELAFLTNVAGIVSGPSYTVTGYNTVAFNLDISSGTATIRVDISSDGLGYDSVGCLLSTQLDRTTNGALISYGTTGLYQCNIAGAQSLRMRTNACAGCLVNVVGRVSTAKIK